MPLVAAGLPILQALDVEHHAHDLGRREGLLLDEDRHLGQRRVLELVQPRGEDLVRQVRGALRVHAEEPLEHEHAVGELALVAGLARVGEQVVAQVHAVGEACP